jgi:RimJ/RimL family protein N-acetyltransferase
MVAAPAELPVGHAVSSAPALFPGTVTLRGRYGSVERLSAGRHRAALWMVMRGHDAIWTYLPAGPFSEQAEFDAYIAACEDNKERIFYAVLDAVGRAVGILSLMEIRPAMRVVEVGNIVYSPALQRTPLATEAQFLIARYAFETLGYRRYEWKCNALNLPSRAAAQRLGLSYEGIFRQATVVKGRNRDTAWYAAIDKEWTALEGAFQAWLAPANFDGRGKQRVRLSALTGPLLKQRG